MSERALQEIYLPAFKAAVTVGKVGAVMNSYNLINGVHATQNTHLNNEILKGQWGFDGILMSDWVATYDGLAAAKGGLKMFTKSMATEWGKYNILTNAIGPGYFSTALTKPLEDDPKFDAWVKSEVPLQRWGIPEELIGAAIFLSSDASSYVNGHTLYVDGGWQACL